MRIAVSGKDGCTLLEYQYNEKPNEGIVAGADCSVALSTKEDFVEEVFSISPNPAHDNVIIQFGSNIPRKGKLVLSMLNGVQVQELNIVQSSQEFSLKDLAAGVYIMSLHDESGILIHSQAIIKQ
ncbi:MAG: T9SS type A sorting domain-containing protein [Bacteroidota bacterium]